MLITEPDHLFRELVYIQINDTDCRRLDRQIPLHDTVNIVGVVFFIIQGGEIKIMAGGQFIKYGIACVMRDIIYIWKMDRIVQARSSRSQTISVHKWKI